jgi:hypothetical protein
MMDIVIFWVFVSVTMPVWAARMTCAPEYFIKHQNKLLDGANVYHIHDITSVFMCDIICSEHGSKCGGANIRSLGSSGFTCALFRALPGDIPRQFIPCQHSSVIVKINGQYQTLCQLIYPSHALMYSDSIWKHNNSRVVIYTLRFYETTYKPKIKIL